MPYRLDDKLVIGISSRALFDLRAEDHIFRTKGLEAYRIIQRRRENDPLAPGTGFRLVQGLLAINALPWTRRLVEVIIISKNDGDAGARIFNSIRHHRLDIARAAFTGGRGAVRFLGPFHCQLFLSAEAEEVVAALAGGFPSALVLERPVVDQEATVAEVLVAFDGDAVLFDDQADQIHREFGIDAFMRHEEDHADEPMSPGPFEPFLRALARVQAEFPEGESPIRTALVTARSAPAHQRVINTLRAWGVRIDESYFLGGIDKTEVLQALRPDIMFDDTLANLTRAQAAVPTAHVPYEAVQTAMFEAAAVEVPVAMPSIVLPATRAGSPHPPAHGTDNDRRPETVAAPPPDERLADAEVAGFDSAARKRMVQERRP